jgi:YD repeat-containing protein
MNDIDPEVLAKIVRFVVEHLLHLRGGQYGLTGQATFDARGNLISLRTEARTASSERWVYDAQGRLCSVSHE